MLICVQQKKREEENEAKSPPNAEKMADSAEKEKGVREVAEGGVTVGGVVWFLTFSSLSLNQRERRTKRTAANSSPTQGTGPTCPTTSGRRRCLKST